MTRLGGWMRSSLIDGESVWQSVSPTRTSLSFIRPTTSPAPASATSVVWLPSMR